MSTNNNDNNNQNNLQDNTDITLEIDSDSNQLNTDTSFVKQSFTPGAIVDTNIVDELKKDYLDYAMSVIVARALPDVRDGLKPSQRRILVSMKDLQLWPEKGYKKCAKIVGETMGKYHPHGDQAIYTTLVHMAQDFSFRYPLVNGQGNFGSIDGDPPAQMRYTEAKMAKITTELLRGLDKGLVTFTPNFDGSELEPTVLPAHFPNLFANGAEGIAVGMATKIPPHNLGELIDALVAIIDAGNKWQGKALYNVLRKAKESLDKRPYLYQQHPLDLLENYFLPHDSNKAEKANVLKELIEHKTLNLAKLKDLFSKTEQQALLEYLLPTQVSGQESITIPNISLYPKIETSLSVSDLMEYVKGPDFATYGTIYNIKEIKQVYETGKGRILIRGKVDIEEGKRGKLHIVISQIPYQVNKSNLVQIIAKLVQLKKIKGIKDIRDESNKEGIRIVLDLKSSANPQVIINKLYKYTPLQINYHANIIALVDKQPITLNLKKYLELYLEFRLQLQIRALEFELAEAKYRGHILEGLLKALDIIDEIIATIKASKNQEEAKTNLITKFDFTELQAQAILDMPLKRLTSLERNKLQDEHKKLMELITHHEKHLENPTMVLKLIKEDLLRIKDTYADKRRTKIIKGTPDQPEEEDLIQEEDVLVTITAKGYIKRTPYTNYKAQRRGGVGSKTAKLSEEDFIKQNLLVSTKDTLLVFTETGKVYKLKTYNIPEQLRASKGIHTANLLAIDSNTAISKVIRLPKQATEEDYLTFLTAKGLVKKTKLSEYSNIHKGGKKAIILKPDDRLQDVILSKDGQDVLISTRLGKGIRFKIDQVRPMSRASRGVKGITLRPDDQTISLEPIPSPDSLLVTVTEGGYIKITQLKKIRSQNRSGKGLRIHKIVEKRGNLVDAKIIEKFEKENAPSLIVTTSKGKVVKTTLANVPTQSRNATGVRIIKTASGDKVVGISIQKEE